jgi:hypothetical protein
VNIPTNEPQEMSAGNMKNKSFIYAIVAILILVSVFLATLYKNDHAEKTQLDQREQLATDLDKLVNLFKNGKVDGIDISSITPFEWEKLYLFSPYSTAEQIFKTLGFTDDIKSYISADDGIILFVFVKDKKVVQYMDYLRNPDFNAVVNETGYSPSEAIFVLDNIGVVMRKSP